jgi:hypothetical protein
LTLAAVVLGLCGSVFAQSSPSPKLEVVSHLSLPGPGAQIWVHKNIAYIGGYHDSTVGVKLIDIADPAKPRLIGTLPRRPGVSVESEDVTVISVDTPAFKGDLLAMGYQSVNGAELVYGPEFWDVSNPSQPRLLSFLPIPTWVHELHLLQREGRVLALLATADGGMRIVDATDPTKPALLSTWKLQEQLGIDPAFGWSAASFNHSVSASPDGKTAYASYWDAGTVILDISDPAAPRYLGRTEPPLGEEGNLRYAVEADEGRLLITTEFDGDPTPSALTLRITAPAALAGLRPAVELGFARPLAVSGPVRGEVAAPPDGRTAENAPSPRGKLLLLEPGPDTQWKQRLMEAQAAGATAVLFAGPMPLLPPLGLNAYRLMPPDDKITIPGVALTPDVAEPIRKAVAAGEKVEIELTAGTPQWGVARLWDIRDRTKPVQIATVATTATRQFPPPGPGSFSVLYAFVRGTRLYATFQSDGVRVFDIANPTEPKEIGQFVPPFAQGTPVVHGHIPGFTGPFPLAWDVTERDGLIYLNDLQTGLWILRDVPR